MGWTSINFVDLQRADTTFPSGPLTLTQATRIVSIFFVCALIGTILLPHVTRKFGIRTTILALGVPQIVSRLGSIGENWEFKMNFDSISDMLAADRFRAKSILFVCCTCSDWPGVCWCNGIDSIICIGDMR